MIKKGDTLIEVTLAIGIFSMVAVSIVTVLSNDTSDAQTALETTLTREEIDTQAEALRFVQSAYIARGDNTANDSSDPYVKLWRAITDQAVNKDDVNIDIDKFVEYSPTSCSELYEEKGQATSGFIINPRVLLDGTEKAIVSNKDSSDVFAPATTYPRLVYKGDTDALLSKDNTNNLIDKAEGIYVIAVKDANSTTINGAKISAFYDFYIRACWYASNSEQPLSISTVIRLYDPDALPTIAHTESQDESQSGSQGGSNTIPPKEYMQEVSSDDLASMISNDGGSITLKDKRDEQEYKITKINNQYWMTQNLRFTGTSLLPSNTNVSSDVDITYGDLTSGEDYSRPQIHSGVDSNGNATVWYNYAAASAKTIIGSNSNNSLATSDICPTGWKLPTKNEFDNIISHASNFDLVAGGYYSYGSLLGNNDSAYWWSATSIGGGGMARYVLSRQNNGSLYTGSGRRSQGYYIRCIKK